jgi:hypothetical protein
VSYSLDLLSISAIIKRRKELYKFNKKKKKKELQHQNSPLKVGHIREKEDVCSFYFYIDCEHSQTVLYLSHDTAYIARLLFILAYFYNFAEEMHIIYV